MSRPTVLAVALVLVWSSGFLAADLGAGGAAGQTLLTWRCLVLALLLAPFLPRPSSRLGARVWVEQAVLALLCQCLYLTGIYWAAAAGVPAGTSALIASMQPAVVLLATAVLYRRAWTRGHVWGVLAGTAGVAVTAAGDLGAGATAQALALPFLAMGALAAGTVLHESWRARPAPVLPLRQSLALQSVFTAGFTAAMSVAGGDLLPPPVPAFWVAVALAVAAGLGSYAAYYRAIDVLGADRTNALLYLTPAVTAVGATLIGGEALRVSTALGLALGGLGAGLLLRQGSFRSRPASVGGACADDVGR
ncbi:DMT family transporter [Nakamurella flava]|uniref:DMT family transporter n=1 Tax=Nakamurella flava TaxID=2576308 RepID=A0A4U6QF34_9ACTN|nr:DMT family transporter [Nakamurella flava]TKV58864.1 DMT family transporter [Nakamurella flava]